MHTTHMYNYKISKTNTHTVHHNMYILYNIYIYVYTICVYIYTRIYNQLMVCQNVQAQQLDERTNS